MRVSSEPTTRVTLIGRLQCQPYDRSAWDQFAALYSPMVFAWCRRWGAQQADAEDVAQLVLLKISHVMANFRYEPEKSFRAWLKTITHHAWHDFEKHQRRPDRGRGDSVCLEFLKNLEARDDLVNRIDIAFRERVLEEAMVRVRSRVAASTWEAFRLTAFEGLKGAEAGERLGMPASLVFLHKHKVRKLLALEVKKLGGDDAES